VLVPDLNRERTELYKAASTDRSGRFNGLNGAFERLSLDATLLI